MIIRQRTPFWTSLLHGAFLLLTASAFPYKNEQVWNNASTPLSSFYSRPDLQPPAMNVTLFNSSAFAPGYVFITPYQELQEGPYIFDKLGNLVYDGFAEMGAAVAHNLHPCRWNGSPHLCMFQGNQLQGYARGHGVILNTDYQIVQTVQSGLSLPAADQHEFRLVDGGQTALMTIYRQVPYDLTRFNVTTQGWIMEGVFQAINISTGAVEFQWNSLEHVDPQASYVLPKTSDIAGNGLTPQSAWDYFHINSIDKSVYTGNYIISARHTSSIYYIDGTTGEIVWTLQAGGNSDFDCQDFNFSFQHDAQIRLENSTTMILSIFDNASNNYNHTSSASSGKIIQLDFTTMTASLVGPVTTYPAPGGLLSASQGNAGVLDNGNIYHGWGSWPYYSEHAPDGTAVWAANIGPKQGVVMSYRLHMGKWTSIPNNTRPALWTFSRNSDSLVAFYVSWNGCTEVASWNFYATDEYGDKWTLLGNTRKNGFETMYTSETHFQFTFAEAIGFDGSSLRNSSVQRTFVPVAALAAACSDYNCQSDMPTHYSMTALAE